MIVDATKVYPVGAWVLVKVDPPPTMKGSLYIPAGNLEERLGQATGTVLRVGKGEWSKKGGKRVDTGIKPNDRVMFRGYLSDINRPGGILDREHCLIHARDIVLIVDED